MKKNIIIIMVVVYKLVEDWEFQDHYILDLYTGGEINITSKFVAVLLLGDNYQKILPKKIKYKKT